MLFNHGSWRGAFTGGTPSVAAKGPPPSAFALLGAEEDAGVFLVSFFISNPTTFC